MSLRILHITPYYLPDVQFGGPVFSVSALCESLVESGAQVTVYTVAYNGKPRVETREGVQVHYFRGDMGSPCQVSRELWRTLARTGRDFDVVHLHTWWNILIFRSLLILRRLGTPAVLSPRGMLSDYSFGHRKTRLKRLFQETAGRRLLHDVGLLATSDAEAQEMEKRIGRPASEIAVIPNLLSLTQTQQYEAPESGFVLGLLSRLHHKKGIDILLQAVAQSPQVTRLVFGGTGDPAYEEWMREEIRRLGISDRVEFAGWISDADKPAFFRSIHVFILPSYNENFANVVAEAWSMGKPVIISTGVGLNNFLEQYPAGWVCDPNTASVHRAIADAWEGRAEWPARGLAGLRLVRDQLNGRQLVQAYWQMYEAQLERAGKTAAPVTTVTAPQQPSYILGINAYHSDASAALYRDGVLLAAAEEERFRRVKHWAGFPGEAIRFCLREAGISITEVDRIALGRDPRAKWDRKARFLANNPRALSFVLRGRLSNATGIRSVSDELAQQFMLSRDSLSARMHYVEHHRSHLASAFYTSPYEEAALLSIDGSGDFTTTMMGVGRGSRIEVLDSIDFPNSLGIFYTAFTQLLGFPNYGDEYKVMGLAPYGVPRFAPDLESVIQPTPQGGFRLDMTWFRSGAEGFVYYNEGKQPLIPELFTQKLEERFGPARQPDEPLTQYHKDLAASVQHTTEQIIFHMLRHLHQRTGLKKLCLAGGVAQNSVANGKIKLYTPFEHVYVPPAGHDAGLALGAALWVHHELAGGQRSPAMRSAGTGCHYSNNEVLAALEGSGLHWQQSEDFDQLCDKVASVIANGGVVGWFRGRAEFGPRALGHRSILADPRRRDAKDLLNHKIKRREPFRPFAPAILEEYTSDFFALADSAPFMERVVPIRREQRSVIPAVTHIDGTGRLQTVSRESNPDFYQLINAFRRITGVPVLLNTSFNENEPIVNTPQEAIDCFRRTKMDLLVMEDIVVSRD